MTTKLFITDERMLEVMDYVIVNKIDGITKQYEFLGAIEANRTALTGYTPALGVLLYSNL